jgi:hypothetical protein
VVDPIILLAILFIILCLILTIRITEVIPNLYIYFTTRKGYTIKFPDDLGLKNTIISYEVGEKTQEGWFFPSEEEEPSTIILIPDWTYSNAFGNSLKTAGVLQLMGYNVLLPLAHDIEKETGTISKYNFTVQYYQKSVEMAYDYLLLYEHINKRQIAIFSESMGTVFASMLVKEYPIKAIVLENGPITLSRLIAGRFPSSGLLATLVEVITRISLWPFLWKTRWNNRSTLSTIHSCPAFQISIFNHRKVPSRDIFSNYNALYKPKQIWIEHAFSPQGGIRDTWPEEFFSQVQSFYNQWLTIEPTVEWHSDIKVQKLKHGRNKALLTIHALPPQMNQIPLCVSLANKKNLVHERIWFDGAEKSLEYNLPFKPDFISTIPYFNVKYSDKDSSWVKLDAQQAIERTIESIASLEPTTMLIYEKRYSNIKREILKDINVGSSENI